MNFADWYASNVAPQVEAQLKGTALPPDARTLIRKASRDAMAACWNAAIDAALKTDAIINASSAQVEEVEALKIRNT